MIGHPVLKDPLQHTFARSQHLLADPETGSQGNSEMEVVVLTIGPGGERGWHDIHASDESEYEPWHGMLACAWIL